MKPSRVLVTGVSGPIGAALLPLLQQQGCEVVRLVRGPARDAHQISWDPAQPVAPEAVSGFDAVIHLAGESIVGRWSEEKKQRIRDSRIRPTRLLAQALASAPQKPSVLVVSSAIGYYGSRGDEILTEQSPAGDQFLSAVCREWEAASEPAAQAGIRTAKIRTGVVLSMAGGALPQMVLPFKMFVGGKIGSGRQWWSWIHVADHVRAIWHVLTNEALSGPVNVVAPRPVTNAQFTEELASGLKRPAIFPMPAFAARLAFGEMADELLLASQRVQPARLEETGFIFQYPALEKALHQLLH
ncbi:MAG: TIGR01777 family protein [Acidobacteriales bacterium]|nr:TIGR01777 family protein [Terriglobales bacterium]